MGFLVFVLLWGLYGVLLSLLWLFCFESFVGCFVRGGPLGGRVELKSFFVIFRFFVLFGRVCRVCWYWLVASYAFVAGWYIWCGAEVGKGARYFFFVV